MRYRFVLITTLVMVFIWGCAKLVKIPDSEQDDKAPVVTVLAFEPTGSGSSLQVGGWISSGIQYAPAGTQRIIFAKAESDGAVHTLVLNVVQGSASLFFVQVGEVGSGSPPQGPAQLSIFGSGGLGVPGNTEIKFVMGNEDVTVVARGINFHNMDNTVTVTFSTHCPPCPRYGTADEYCNCHCQVNLNTGGSGFDAYGTCGGFCCGPNEYCCDGKCIRFDELCCPGTTCPGGYHCEPQYPGKCCPNGTSYDPSSNRCYPSSSMWGF